MTEKLQQKYREYLLRESKYSHINPSKTYQDWKNNYLEIHASFSNALD